MALRIDDVEIELYVAQAFLGGTLPTVSIQALAMWQKSQSEGFNGAWEGLI